VIQITFWIQGLFSEFVTIGKYRKLLTDINMLLILIPQMAAVVRRALAEACTVPVLLVNYNNKFVYGALFQENPVELCQDSWTKSPVHSLLPLLILFALYYWQDCLRRYSNSGSNAAVFKSMY